MKIYRIFSEKKEGLNIESKGIFFDLKENLEIIDLTKVRVINRYDIETDSSLEEIKAIFSEAPADRLYEEQIDLSDASRIFAYGPLPGQYDQRADFASQCVQLVTLKERPRILTARVIALYGNISMQDFEKIKSYMINPVECMEVSLDKPGTLSVFYPEPDDIKAIEGFMNLDDKGISSLRNTMALAMTDKDLALCREYFKNTEKRDPTETEIKVLDTYWSDHCRHTTFLTEINNVCIEKSKYTEPVKVAFDMYKEARNRIYGKNLKKMTLMDVATIAMKKLKKDGYLDDLDESDEINACSIKVDVDVDGATEEWALMFKNETHNHPTEIEPFGGAATCVGGAIRDPLSGRSYVYQAMRITGSADPRTDIKNTIPGRLPQRKITTTAAAGYSSYGNQIGLATGQVDEIYHPGYAAKRMELGAVIGAAPLKDIVRKKPRPGDVVVLLGGRTGRDGCGGATGSSKEHDEKSLASCGAEVQKGNPPTERYIQRLFRKPEATRIIKKCNDFGAGGVSVAIGELADGLVIDLDKVPKKYQGLNGTELAISESQERMAVLLAPDDAAKFIELAGNENLEATVVAHVTEEKRVTMFWRGKKIVDIARKFLDTNGASQDTDITIRSIKDDVNLFSFPLKGENFREKIGNVLSDLNVCSKKGMSERFCPSVGALTVLLPWGGASQETNQEGMCAKLPVPGGKTDTASVMTYGYDPYLSEKSPFHGGVYSVVQALSKLVAMGADYKKARLSLQEYFEKCGNDSSRWGKPMAALLGAMKAQLLLGVPAIGGKDSMSGTFKDIDVPPTLVAFAVGVISAKAAISAEFKNDNSNVYIARINKYSDGMPDFIQLKKSYNFFHELSRNEKISAASGVHKGGIASTVCRMCFGNEKGFVFNNDYIKNTDELFDANYGSVIFESNEKLESNILSEFNIYLLGKVIKESKIIINEEDISLKDLHTSWSGTLDGVFPKAVRYEGKDTKISAQGHGLTFKKINSKTKYANPNVLIPVFPGTNCEYESGYAFENAGARVEFCVVKNLSAGDIKESVDKMVKMIRGSQIIMLPGGFSAGDEPEGCAKFIASMFKNPYITEAIEDFLNVRDGLILGICNGFQALVKLGLLPGGHIKDMGEDSPILTFNNIGRHVAFMVDTKVVSVKSPWLYNTREGDIHKISISHGEGRFVAPVKLINELYKNGQVATQYVDKNGNPTMEYPLNPNGSMMAIEGIISQCGRILGKMGHSERVGENISKNVPGNKNQGIFKAGVDYFS